MKLNSLVLMMCAVCMIVGNSFADTEVLPEYTTKIELSNSDINRIHCSHGDIGDVLFSEEKGIDVKIHGRDAFIKFSVQHSTEGLKYNYLPAELYVVCGEDMYMMISEPKKIPATTIKLSSPLKKRISESRNYFQGLAFEEKNKKLIKHAYTDTLPDYFKIDNVAEEIGIFSEVKMQLIKIVRVEGEGILLKEYVLRNETDRELNVQEEDFLIKEITRNASAVSLDPHHLSRGEKGRLFIVERVQEANSMVLFSKK